MTPSEIIQAAMLQPTHNQRERERHVAAQILVAGALARFTAERTERVSFEDAWDALRGLPDNLLHLLNSAEGWSVIDSLIRIAAGEAALPVHPTRH